MKKIDMLCQISYKNELLRTERDTLQFMGTQKSLKRGRRDGEHRGRDRERFRI
jgi:hypothetical protein